MTPTMLIDVLSSLRGRLRAWSAVYGLGVVLAAAIVGLLAIATLDWLVHLSRAWRLLLDVALLGGLGWLAMGRVVRPLLREPTLGMIAARVERRFPQFEDRLQSAVAFIERPTPDSPALQRATIQQAVDIASALPIAGTLDPRPALRVAGVGLGLAALAALGLLVLDGSSRSILLSRLFNPMSRAVWPNRVEIAFLGQVPDRVPSGGQLDVKLRLVRGDSPGVRPTIYYVDQDGVRRQEFLTRGADGEYAVSLDAKAGSERGGSLRWWVVAGDAKSPEAGVAILPKLSVEQVLAALTPPDYVPNGQPATYDLGGRSATGLVGSRTTFTIRFSKPIPEASSVRLIPSEEGGPVPAVEWTAADGRTVTGTAPLAGTLRFRVDARDADGFGVSSPSEYEVVARPDELPTISIESPRRNSEERTAEATVPLVATIGDDAGIQDVSLVVKKLGDSSQEWTLPLVQNSAAAADAGAVRWSLTGTQDERQRFRLEHDWVLASLKSAFKPGDVLEYFVRVTDNYALNGERHPPVDSPKGRITIISQEQLSARAIDELRQVRRQVDEVKKEHDRATADTRAMADDLAKKPALDAADRAVAARLRQQLGTGASAAQNAADRLSALRRSMEENKSESADLQQLSKDVAAQLATTAEGTMKSALQSMGNAEAAPAADQRQRAIEQTIDAQTRASDELANTIKRLDEVGSLNAAIDEFKRALEAQKALSEATRDLANRTAGQTADQMKPADREAMKQSIDAQAGLAEKTQKMLDRLGKTADQIAKADPATAEAMRAAQKQGQSKGVAQSQKQASQQMQQNQQANAKQSQQKAEAGLEVVLGQLREAQSRKLAELQKKLAELQQQIAVLIRRQAGHNLDNLTLQGGAVTEAEAKTIEALRAKGERKAGEPAPALPRLLTAQGQTERNARDIAKKAADVPDGSEPAARISRAATLMERAAVYVRDKKLPEAYQPPQIDALAALEEAGRVIDEQKQKVDDDIAGQQQEAIRQAFVRIRGEQEKLAGETKRLDAGRTPEGKLNRVDAVRAGLLPGEQQKLVDDVNKTGEQLASLQSVVYIWANKQIANAMSDLKAKLAATDTSALTQRLHGQVLADLDAMIENLKVTPRERRFENGGGGGGGGGGGSPGAKPMPAEAELRMLKSLQTTVNAGTEQAQRDRDAKGNGDAKAAADAVDAAVVALGRRQIEVRSLLDELMQAASQGQTKLPPVKADAKPLPEEEALAKVDDRELEAALLGGDPGASSKAVDVNRIGDRMARSGTRLESDRDPGAITQVVQKRILLDFDLLIEEARQQQCNGKGSPSPSKGEPKPDAGAQQAQNKGQNTPSGGQTAAAQSSAGGQTGTADRSGKAIDERAEEWGRISQRLRGPVLESRDEQPVGRYIRLIQDYTQAVSTEASGGGNASSASPTTAPAGTP